MNKDTLIAIITNQDPKLAQAVSKMVDYIQDRWAMSVSSNAPPLSAWTERR